MCACIYEATIPDGRYLAHGWKVFPVTFVLIHSVNPKNIGGELVCEFSKRQTNDDVNEKIYFFFSSSSKSSVHASIPVLASSDNVTRYDFR